VSREGFDLCQAKYTQLIEATVFRLLLSDIIADCFLIRTNRIHKVTSGLKMLTRKILLSPHIGSGYMNGTFAFQITYNLRNRIFRRYRHEHVNMIGQKMPFDNLTLLLYGKVSEG
jgi:hypothetical protein